MRLEDPHRPFVDEVGFPCPQCGARMERVPEVIDVWFDSGSMPFAQYHAPFENLERFEARSYANFVCEALDQTRGWFYSLLAISVLLFDRSPYETVVCLGLILDGDGQKMSKSKGNIVAPREVIDRFGADAVRWYFFTAKNPWDGYRFNLGDDRRVDPALPAPAVEHLRLPLDLRARARGRGDRPRPLDPVAPERHGRGGHRAPGRLRHDDGRPGHRRVRRRSLQLVRARLAAALLGGRRRRLRHARDGAAHRRQAGRPLHALHRRRALRQPRRHRALGPSHRLARSGSRPRPRHRPRARDGGGARDRAPRPLGARGGEGQAAPAAEGGGRRGRRARARGHRAPGRHRARPAQRQAAALRPGRRRARLLRRQAQLPRARAALRQADAAGGRGGRGARPRARRRGAARGPLDRHRGRRPRPPAQRRRPGAGHGAARRLPAGARGLARGGARARLRRRAAARGARARGRPRGPERAQGRGPGRRGPHPARARRRRRAPRRGAGPRGVPRPRGARRRDRLRRLARRSRSPPSRTASCASAWRARRRAAHPRFVTTLRSGCANARARRRISPGRAYRRRR